MPFIDENKIAELYKEVDVLRNSSTYFQDLYLKSKKKISKSTFYKNLSIIVFLTLLFVITVWTYESSSEKVITSKVDKTTSIPNLNKNNDIIPTEFNKNLRIKRIYTVQIAATKNDPFLLFSKDLVNFKKTKSKEYNRYSLGNFKTKEEAEDFKKEIIKLGIKDAWVVAYENDKRIILNE